MPEFARYSIGIALGLVLGVAGPVALRIWRDRPEPSPWSRGFWFNSLETWVFSMIGLWGWLWVSLKAWPRP